jgi:hypothetical protein
MTVSSLQLVIQCQQKGLLSKEAAVKLLHTREELIKVAMRKQAAILVASIRALNDDEGETKEAGFPFGFGRAAQTAKKGEGFLSKLRTGGLTGRGGKDGAGHTGWSDVGLNLGKMLGLAGITAGATAGVGGIIHHSREKKLKGEIDRSYGEVFNQEPRLKELQEEHPGVVERNFGILAKFAPSLAAEPSIAANWLHSSIAQGALGPSDIKNLVEVQHKVDEMHEGRRHGGPLLAPMSVDRMATTVLKP